MLSGGSDAAIIPIGKFLPCFFRFKLNWNSKICKYQGKEEPLVWSSKIRCSLAFELSCSLYLFLTDLCVT